MKKRILIAGLGIILILFILNSKLFSQRDNTPVAVPLSALEDIQNRLNNILSSLERVQAASLDTVQKLEQVLANQAEIKQELNTIRIRTFKK